MKISRADKLRTLLTAAKFSGQTQKQLAADLGISTRTLRRFKNQKGYQLAPRTFERIGQDLDDINRGLRRVFKNKAWNPRTKQLEKVPGLKLPPMEVFSPPTLYPAKGGRSQTFRIDCEFWSMQQKIAYLIDAQRSGQFSSWFAKVKVPVGVARSGDIDSIYDDDDESVLNVGRVPEYYIAGPLGLSDRGDDRYGHSLRQSIRKEIKYHEDAGRIIVNISIVEVFDMPKPKRKFIER